MPDGAPEMMMRGAARCLSIGVTLSLAAAGCVGGEQWYPIPDGAEPPEDAAVKVESFDLLLLIDAAPPPDVARAPDLAQPWNGPSSDVAEEVLDTWDVGETLVDTIEACAPRPGPLTHLAADTLHLQVGRQAVRIDYGPDGEKYFDAIYPKSRDARWDLNTRAGVTFWLDGVLPAGYTGWQPDGPTVVLCSDAGGYRRLDPSMNLTPRVMGSWLQLKVPLVGGGGWTAMDVGAFDVARVSSIELHFDPLRNAMPGLAQVWIDGLLFY